MLTKSGVNKLLRRIMETGGLTPDMEEDIKRLKDELDEREGVLRKYGEWYDGEDKDEFEYAEKASDHATSDADWERRYRELKERYIDRFFGGTPEEEERDEESESEEEKEVTVEELFEKKEVK